MLALRLALRELRGGLSGLRLLAICLVLGTLALAGVGSLSSAIRSGLADNGQTILGGDIEARLTQRVATPAERAALAKLGRVAEVVRLRAMAGRAGADVRVLAELKAVDTAYPLVGTFTLANGATLAPGTVAPSTALAERLGVKAGDSLSIGIATLRVAGIVAVEPDKAGEGFGFGPGLVMRLDDLGKTGLIAPGSLFRAHYRVLLASGDPQTASARLRAAAPDAGWQIGTSDNAAPGTRQFVDRLGQFLTLVSLTALVVAGVGVGNGVAAYLDAKSGTIATLKSVGADGGLIFRSYLLQIGVVALAAVAVGAALGAAVPFVMVAVAGDALPVPPTLGIYPAPLLTAGAYGLLIALAFALWPLARARAMPAARLFRDAVEGGPRPEWGTLALIALAGAAIVGLAVGQSGDRLFALGFIGGALALLLALGALAAAIRFVAARLPRPKGPLARLALGNLHRPGALTRQLVVALGLGLTLFATLAVIEANLGAQIERSLPQRAPSFFVIDVPTEGLGEFRQLVRTTAPDASLRTVPSLRGPVTAVRGVPVAKLRNLPEDAWILRGDRGLSYAADFPPNNVLTAGKWWPSDYAGPPLVSIDEVAANALGLKIGDTLTLSVLGVEVTATITSFRKIDWQSLGFNFAILFAPGTLEAAPHSWMATVAMAPAQERGFQAAMTRTFPTASTVRVADVLGQVSTLLGQLSAAIRAAGSLTLAAGIAVLVGALAAGRRARTYDAVLLKVLGATRGQVARATLMEYAVLGGIVAGVAMLLGTFAGWYVVVQVFKLAWQPAWGPVVLTVVAGGVLTIVLALAGSWRALSARPNTVLRTL